MPRLNLHPALWLLIALIWLAGCGRDAASQTQPTAAPAGYVVDLATLTPVPLADDERLRVVATTNLVADVVRRVGGDAVELTTLMPVGADPHTYTATPQDLRTLADAHVVLVNGLGLEEPLAPVLDTLDGPPVISVNAGVATRAFGEEAGHAEEAGDDHAHGGIDPHTWLRVANVMVWAENVAAVLAALDPSHAADYTAAGQAYRDELEALDGDLRARLEALPAERRKLVADHDSLGYFADEYGFTVIGALIPSFSTLAAPSAQELAALQDTIRAENVPAIFVETTVSPELANRLARDLGVQVVTLYTGSLSDPNGPAADYPAFMRYNVDAIVAALAP
jgi:ABC-type Zn uptake system ZnuABC Zn-binding protein ZnuA